MWKKQPGKSLSGPSRHSLQSDFDEVSSEVDGVSDCSQQSNAQQIARKESASVWRWKTALAIMLLITTAFVVASAFIFLNSEELLVFEDTFYQYAFTIRDVAHYNARSILESFESKADTITSFAISSDLQWPFLTIPHFETRFEHSRNDSFAEVIAFAPLITTYQRNFWEKYSVMNQNWMKESLKKLENDNMIGSIDPGLISENIYTLDDEGRPTEENSWGPFAPIWQISPPPTNASIMNYNLLSDPVFSKLATTMEQDHHAVLSPVWDGVIFDHTFRKGINGEIGNTQLRKEFEIRNHNDVDSINMNNTKRIDTPRSLILQPLYDSHDSMNRSLVGILMGVIAWDDFLSNLLPDGVDGITCVIENNCDDVFTYEIAGGKANYIGRGRHHERQFESNHVPTYFGEFHAKGYHCHYGLKIYPTGKFQKRYLSRQPLHLTLAIATVFVITFFMFAIFAGLVDKRQNKVMTTAVRANAIVSSLFPSSVRDRIMRDTADNRKPEVTESKRGGFFAEAPKKQLKTFLNEENIEGDEFVFNTKPIADLFPEATVLFADISGFTAWSSVRNPSQVFQLLETIYHSFDMVAKRRRVFKVETVGDCYVAVTGLPDPRKDHAILMARFSRECLHKMHVLTKKLEITLGPDTGDLSMRFGLHSGPVTAGVLRGEKSRFQLFGDTVNTAARMESNGARGRIHISQETADLLVAAGKSKWVTPREGTIQAKGKGELKTFWLQVIGDDAYSSEMNSSSASDDFEKTMINDPPAMPIPLNQEDFSKEIDKVVLSPKMQRLVDWNVDQLSRLLRAVVARRNALKKLSNPKNSLYEQNNKRTGTVLEEVKEVITLPNFDANTFKSVEDPDSIELPNEAMTQLHDYVTKICMMYRHVPFHNFEHASHVTMSVSKLLSRIVAPDDVNYKDDSSAKTGNSNSTKKIASALHDHTYGITSDPLTQFSCVFSALIHDVDHTGVPNLQLVKESTILAARYKNQSVAEQNSVDLAWELLMDEKYKCLRKIIYASESEFNRFRQLIVNSVMATDIADKELKKLRNARWEKAFSGETPEDLDEDRNRKATIVIEHLIQASDIAHTMQHWHIYRKWNERLFREQYLAYKAGRQETEPSTFWYKGEIGFFDFYIIPLAKKLKDCGVFGVSSDEYLNYAVKNREEWEIKGERVVQDMKNKMADIVVEECHPG